MVDGAQARKLTEQTVFAYDLAPDGRQLAFLSDDEGERRIYRLDLTSGVVTPIASEITNPIDVAWSPQGDRLAVAANLKGDADLFLLAPDGRFLGVIADSPEDETAPAWTPDGQQLVYVSPHERFDQLYLWNGQTTRRLTKGDQHHRHPVWRGDGQLYCLTGDRGYYRPASVDLDTGSATPFWSYRESVLELTPAEDGFFVILYNDQRAEVYRFQP